MSNAWESPQYFPFIDLDSIKELSDIEMQKQLVAGKIPTRFFDFDDWYFGIFEDSGLDCKIRLKATGWFRSKAPGPFRTNPTGRFRRKATGFGRVEFV